MNKQDRKEYQKEYYIKNREKLLKQMRDYRKKYYQNNKGKELEQNKKWLDEHPEYLKKYTKEHYIKNKDKITEQHKKWQNNNPEYLKKYHKEYSIKNKIKISEKSKLWRENNLEHNNKQQKEYRIKNKDKIIQKSKEYNKTENGKASRQRGHIKRRIIEKEIINTLTANEWLDILRQHNFKCAYCGKDLFDLFTKPERDHVIPISKGGNNVKENVVPACKSCNCKKGNRMK
jgi:5-methylcytosine-specific restriction endonuclease McrA